MSSISRQALVQLAGLSRSFPPPQFCISDCFYDTMATSTAFNAANHGLQIGNNSGSITAEFHVARAYTTEDIDRISLHALRCPDSLAVKNRLKESKDRLNADYELNTLEAILKGLILQLANQQPELKESLRRRWDTIQEAFTEDVTSWRSLWNILFEMLARCKSSRVYMVVDALDECENDDVVDFLKSIVRKGLDHPGKIKWLLTSRPWDGAERVLLAGPGQVQINLDGEYNSQSVSGAVAAYIVSKVEQLSRQHRYGATLKSEIETELTERSEETFLWVSLVCKALESVSREDALATVQSLPPGLHPFYDGVLSQLNQGEPTEVQKCMRLLKAMMTVYRPLKVEEVAGVIGLTDEEETIRALVDCCASFIRLREDHIEFVHQSARDYLAGENGLAILDSHGSFGHEEIVLACMSYLSKCLKPNLVDLPRPDATRGSLEVSENGPNEPRNGILSRVDYAAMFWVSHLKNTSKDSDKSQVGVFLHNKLLEWLECLSLLDRLLTAIDALRALEEILKDDGQALAFVQDAMRFLMRHYHTVSHWPLQIYSSALVFSPESSLVRGENLDKVPVWLERAPPMEEGWTPLIQTLTGHEETVEVITFSPDGRQIASGDGDGVIKIWDTVTGSLQQTLEERWCDTDMTLPPDTRLQWCVTAMAFLPDSRLLLSGSSEGSLKLWDTTTGERQKWISLRGPDDRDGGPPSPYALAFSADCRQLAAVGVGLDENSYIMLFDATTGDRQKILQDHPHRPLAMAFSLDNTQLVASYLDGTIRIWDPTTGGIQKTLVGHKDRIWNVVSSPDSKRIVSACHETVNFWDAATGDLQLTATYPNARAVAFSPDGKQCAVCFTHDMIIWDTESKAQKTIAFRSAAVVMSMAWSPNGKEVVTGSSDNIVRRWGITLGDTLHAIGHSARVEAAAISPDGKVIASGSADKTVKLWDPAKGDLAQTLTGHQKGVFVVRFSSDNKQLASCSAEAVHLWDGAIGDPQRSLKSDDDFSTIAFSPDSQLIATGHKHGRIRLWDPATGDIKMTLAGHVNKLVSLAGWENQWDQMSVTILAFSPSGKLMASASEDGTFKLWDPQTGDLLKRLECRYESMITAATVALTTGTHRDATVFAVDFSPDGQHIAAVCDDQTIKAWNIKKSLKASKFLGRAVGSHIKSSRPWKEIQTAEQAYDVHFTADSRYLETDIGKIALEITTASEEGGNQLPVQSDSDSLQNLYVRDGWIRYGTMPFLRLLPDFQVNCWDANGNQVVVGFTTGLVLCFDIDRRGLHQYWEHFSSDGTTRPAAD
ncbi:unnamed protein product [Clonostachys chloroleuca]|uniref:Nephrocystin 3-like N-terminal domain-containing protein n=1 Tax=Clonostachys chloroleuca TaxID=1926264 RepID=A0AA35Q4U4_9HYPO|nr:unnamed protein product [Clonostachys chloroleuca]